MKVHHSHNQDQEQDKVFMQQALQLAQQAGQEDEVPVGAILVEKGNVIARGYNQKEQLQDPLAHAEILAIRDALKGRQSWRLDEATMYVTLEPCLMCLGAMIQARIKRIVYAAKEPKGGCIHSSLQLHKIPNLNHYPLTLGGVLEQESAVLLKAYFKNHR
jgi:tRNA(adenine34) deaminase